MGTTQSTPSGCTFTNGSYQVSEAQLGYFQPCFAEATNFSNFVYQVSMTVTKGSRVESGILFRATRPWYQYPRTLTSGKIGVAAIDYGVPTAVEFSNAKVWNS